MPVILCKSDAESGDRLWIQSPALHIFVSRICLFCQIFKKEDSSLTVHLIDLVFLSFISVSELVHLYAVFFGQLRNRRMKIDIFDLHQKRNHIPGRTASETVKKLFTFRDNKRRCLFIVKRTEPLMASAGSLEFDITPHDIYNVTPALDFLCYVITAQYKPSTFCLFDTKVRIPLFF